MKSLFRDTAPFAPLLLTCVLTACAVGNDYQRPAVSAPTQWLETSAQHNITSKDNSEWQHAEPADTQAKGAWWEIFGDAQLNALQQQAQLGNFNLQAAVARIEQARALTQVSRSTLLPTFGVEAAHTRTRTSANRPTANDNSATSTLRDNNTAALTATYEVDLFGRVRRDIEANKANAQQATADLENVRLLLAADVAANYFALRALDTELTVIDRSLTVQGNILDIVRSRYADGVASGIDLAQQELIVSNNRTQQQLLLKQQSQQKHALATLLGVRSDELNVSTAPLPENIPSIPLLLPGDLLQRRPDIASAERAVAAANAQIGVARAARFPSFSINARDGFESTQFSRLFDAPSAAWSLGAELSQTLFDAGRKRANEKYAIAKHSEATAQYRQAVLSAWQEVEDHLAGTRTLAAAREDAHKARIAAEKIANITDGRYEAGLASAVERYTARQNALNAQREEIQLTSQQWVNAVALIKALGGGWNGDLVAASDLR